MSTIQISNAESEQTGKEDNNSNPAVTACNTVEDIYCRKCGRKIFTGPYNTRNYNSDEQIFEGDAGCFSFGGRECSYPCPGGQLFPSGRLNPFIHADSFSRSSDNVSETLLNIPDVRTVKTETDRHGNVIITVESTVRGTCCGKCGRKIYKPYGHGRDILLRHLSVFGRKTCIYICPPRYQCIYCEGSPVTTQKSAWYEQRSHCTKAYEDHVLLQSVNSTVADVSIKEDIGYEAVMGIIDRRIAVRADWKEIRKLDVLGPDEISLKKGHKDYVTIVTAHTGGKTVILAVLKDRCKKTVKKFLKMIPKRLKKTVRGVCSDMYDGFINAAKEVFGKRIRIVIDRFHVARLYRKDFEGLRKKEMRRLKKELSEEEYGKLKGAMRALRKKEKELSDEEKQVLKCLFGHSPKLETAYRFCMELTDIFEDDISKSEAKQRIRIWKIPVRTSGLKCFDSFLKTLKKRSEEITNYFVSRQTSGFVEGLNNKIKVIKRRCYGIINISNLFRRIFLDLRGYSLFA